MERVGCQGLVYKSLYDTLRVHVYKNGVVPCQYSFPSSAGFLKAPADVERAREFVEGHGLKTFVHSNVCFNPSSPLPNNIRTIKDDLQVMSLIGGGGVVIHVGKHCNRDDAQTSLQTMASTCQELTKYASAASPLILETPAGQGTELCTTIEEFANFYRTIADAKFKVCIDTQHVFGAGYDPLEYIETWVSTCPDSLRLIHLNDSRVECGSRLDRHARVGTGHIGLDKLNQVCIWAAARDIPLVFE